MTKELLESISVPDAGQLETFTGERFIPGLADEMHLEHFHRYALACLACEGKDVLDIACGEGYGSYLLAQRARTVTGVDIDLKTVSLAQDKYKLGNLSFKSGRCEAIPLEDASVDVVVSFETLEHFTGHDAFFAEIKRVLRPSGLLIISTPDKEVYNRQRSTPNEFHVGELTKPEFETLTKRFFRHVHMSMHRTMFVSAILSAGDDASSPFVFVSGASKQKLTFGKVAPDATYLIAACSDAPLPMAVNSLFEATTNPNALSALSGGIRERDEKIKALNGKIGKIQDDASLKITEAESRLNDSRKQLERRSEELVKNQKELRRISDLFQSTRERELSAFRKFGSLETKVEEHQRYEAQQLLKAAVERRAQAKKSIKEILRPWGRQIKHLPRYRSSGPVGAFKLAALERRLLASRLFDHEWYLRQNRDVAAAGFDPLTHYIMYGWKEGRKPTPLFDATFYCSQLNAALSPEVIPFEHFCVEGAYRGLSPCHLFDSEFYLKNNEDVARSGEIPLRHYLEFGAAENRCPHPLFDAGYYQAHCSELSASAINPLLHFARAEAWGRVDPHPLFSIDYYLKQDVELNNEDALTHYLRVGAAQRLNPHPLFDSLYYIGRNPELWLEKNTNLLLHYVTEGAKKGLDPSPFFDSKLYIKDNPDVGSLERALTHYLKYGSREGRRASPYFDPEYYGLANPDVTHARVNPLSHYLQYGRKEGRLPNQWRTQPVGPEIADVLIDTHIDDSLEQYAESFKLPECDNPKVSIVIPVYNQVHFTLRCLKSVALFTGRSDYEVIVVDDCSTDASKRLLPHLKNLKYVRAAENGGFIRSCELGASCARGDYLLLLNNDTCVMKGWLDALVQTFIDHENVGLVGSKLLYPGGRLQEAGGMIWPDATGWNYGRMQHAEDCRFNFVRDVDYCSGACIIIPLKLWSELGGFDKRYLPAYYEDTDLAFRVREKGLRVLYQPFSSVIHFEGATSGTDLASGAKKYQAENLPKFKERWASALSSYIREDDSRKRYLDRTSRGQILIIDATTPTPDKDSGSADMFCYMQILRSIGYGITFIPLHNFLHLERYTEQLQSMGVECIYAPFSTTLKPYLKAEGRRFDIAMLFRVTVASETFACVKRFAPQAKIIFDTVDLHYLRMEREAKLLASQELARRAARTKRRELKLIEHADATIVLSEREMEIVKAELPAARLVHIPIVRDIPGCLAPFEGREGVIFVGGFSHSPNVDAAHYLVEQIWPLVLQQNPEAKLTIIGSGAPESIRNLASKSVTFAGYVPNLVPVMRQSLVNVAPLRYGAGVKGKIVSALSYGVPCVATTVAAEGMGLTHERNVLVADNPQTFADAVVRLMDDQVLWESISKNGVCFAEEHFSKTSVTRQLKDLIQMIAPGSAG